MLIYGLPLLLGFFLVSATLFGAPSSESNFTVDEYGKRHYVLIPEKTQSSFLDDLMSKVFGRHGSEHKFINSNDLIFDSESLLLLPFTSGLFLIEHGPESTTETLDDIVDFEFNSSFKIIENDLDFTVLEKSEEKESSIDTSISVEIAKTTVDYNFNQLQIGGH